MTIDIRALKKSVSIVDMIRLQVYLEPSGTEFIGNCPMHIDNTLSLHVNPGKSTFYCSVCKMEGDVINWVRETQGLSFTEALNFLRAHSVTAVPRPIRRENWQSHKQRIAEKVHAAGLWAAAKPIKGTIGEIFLKSKGLIGPIPNTLRFIDKWAATYDSNMHLEPKYASIVAIVQDVSGDIAGAHQIFLADNGLALANKAVPKRNWGSAIGNALRLAPPGSEIIICEDLENGLAMTRLKPDVPVWVAPLPGGMSGMKLPACVESVCIAIGKNPEGDAVMAAALEKARASFVAQRKLVKVIVLPSEFNDFVDLLFGIRRRP